MNCQFFRLLATLIFLVSFAFVGCDLGTYSKRFKERNTPAKADTPTPEKKPEAGKTAENEDSEVSGDSQ